MTPDAVARLAEIRARSEAALPFDLATHAFQDVPWLLDRLAAETERANRLQSCDCASAEDGNPHHQGYCRSLPTKERQERAKRFAECYLTLAADTRNVNALARELADSRDETAHALAEVEDWREKWAIVDEDRCEAQRERDAATERADKAEALRDHFADESLAASAAEHAARAELAELRARIEALLVHPSHTWGCDEWGCDHEDVAIRADQLRAALSPAEEQQ